MIRLLATLQLLPALLHAQQPSAPRELTSVDLGQWLDGVVPKALTDGDIAGAVVLVVKDGRVVFQKGYGLADVAHAKPMDPVQTLVGVGSVSKLFTWTAVMQQVEAGKLDLDRDVNDYLDYRIPTAFGRPITLRHLMTHSAGFEERSFRIYQRPRALREHLLSTPSPDRIFPSGEIAAYSNYGSMVAGYIVERVSGIPFPEYVERMILEPLGMHRSTFRRPIPEKFRSALSESYSRASGDPKAEELEEPAGDPSGHLVATATDMSRFMLAHLQRGRLDSVVLLRPETADTMHAPSFLPLPGANPLALGFFRLDRNGRRIIGHQGDILAFHADLELLPDEGVGFFFAVNSSGARRGLFGAGHLLRASLFPRFMDRYFPTPAEAEQPTVATAHEHARIAAGEYQMSRRPTGDFMVALNLFAREAMGLRIVAHDDGTLETPAFLNFDTGLPQRWREVGDFQWREVGGTARLDMRVEHGRVTGMLPRSLFSFILQPLPWYAAARPNVLAIKTAAAILFLVAIGGALLQLLRRWQRRPVEPIGRATWIAALAGSIYLAGWLGILLFDVASRGNSEPWIRAAQALIIPVLLATALAAARVFRGWKAASAGLRIGAAVVALAMLEVFWFSIAFDLLSLRLVY